jgi:hypothetical protein
MDVSGAAPIGLPAGTDSAGKRAMLLGRPRDAPGDAQPMVSAPPILLDSAYTDRGRARTACGPAQLDG